MTIAVRFAPSPTGRLHIGNARTAVLNWLFARKHKGRFFLRLDDTDATRCKEEYARAIIADLAWLGLEPEAIRRQSERLDLHAAAARRLKAAGLLYPCYETEAELSLKRKAQRMAGRPPVYDRAALELDAAARAAYEAQGRAPHWRFRLPDTTISWHDAVRGKVSIDPGSISDPVLVRADGSFLYTLPSVVDDMEMGITHVIRGEDHVVNTAVQIALTQALGGEPPVHAHHSLLTAKDGGALSKRLGSLGIGDFARRGLEPETIVSYCATVGSARPVDVHPDMEELARGFELSGLSRAPARFDEKELETLNAKLLHAMPFEVAAPRLEKLGLAATPAFWEAVRGNLATLADAAGWLDVIAGEIAPRKAPEDAGFLRRAAALLPPEPWDETTWKTWTRALKEATGRKGKALFMPLREALTGRSRGPEMSRLLPLMGRRRALARLEA